MAYRVLHFRVDFCLEMQHLLVLDRVLGVILVLLGEHSILLSLKLEERLHTLLFGCVDARRLLVLLIVTAQFSHHVVLRLHALH